MKRYQFLRWLKIRVCKTPDGVQTPRIVIFLYYILFPLNVFYEKQSHIFYDALRNTYTIQGVTFSGEIFSYFQAYAHRDDKFQFIERKNGEITIKRLEDDVEKI